MSDILALTRRFVEGMPEPEVETLCVIDFDVGPVSSLAVFTEWLNGELIRVCTIPPEMLSAGPRLSGFPHR